MKIKLIGATESVTGSKHLLLTESGSQILLDCGLFQGMGRETDELNRKLNLNPAHLEAILLTHAHIDHSGAIPYYVSQGFRGRIYCTEATFDVCKLLLLDSANIQESDIFYINKKRFKQGKKALEPLYTEKDAVGALKQFHPVKSGAEIKINNEVSFHFTETGHIIGAAAINLTLKKENNIRKLTYTGDIGRYTDPIMKKPQVFPQADFVICESTYGDRLHEETKNMEGRFLDIVCNTCITKKGKLIIPAFSLGRTQEILYILNKLEYKDRLPNINIYVDSPLSTEVTKVVKKHKECFNKELVHYIQSDPTPFDFENLYYIKDVEASKEINRSKEPCIIISASGMGDAGRVKHHIKYAIEDSRNTILVMGYCAPYTLCHRLLSGEESVHIFGDYFKVKAEITSILSLSAHADQNELVQFLACQDKNKLKTIFLVHGEEEAKAEFKIKLLEEGFYNVQIPAPGDVYDLFE
ncbi:MAG: MBL fold metallo-hydrolase [Sphingobacteriaceae bacterium]|nr:MBL fold metallo-hydrolase [Sphingobacteriaceae bacterium]